MQGREFKNAMYMGLAKLMKSLSNPARLEIIEMLSQGEKNVEEIVQLTNLTVANASQHLQVLKNNNIVRYRKVSHYVYYSLTSDELLALYQHITKFAVNEIAELEKILIQQRQDNLALNSVSLDELEDMIKHDNILLLDVRPTVEYESGHINGAVSIPLTDLMCCLKDFSTKTEIIAYCRGPFCVLADEAVRVLTENGFNVRRLDEGYPEWKIRQLENK